MNKVITFGEVLKLARSYWNGSHNYSKKSFQLSNFRSFMRGYILAADTANFRLEMAELRKGVMVNS